MIARPATTTTTMQDLIVVLLTGRRRRRRRHLFPRSHGNYHYHCISQSIVGRRANRSLVHAFRSHLSPSSDTDPIEGLFLTKINPAQSAPIASRSAARSGHLDVKTNVIMCVFVRRERWRQRRSRRRQREKHNYKRSNEEEPRE